MKIAYLSLGSNLGDREASLQEAVDRLHSLGTKVKRVSPVYETAPRDMITQPAFLNAVVEIETQLFPMQLLSLVMRIEREMGRKRIVAKGPRLIDVDVIAYGAFTVSTPQLQIPHPRMHERRFVLEPLAELAPEWRHPASRQTVREMLAQVRDQQVRRASYVLRVSE